LEVTLDTAENARRATADRVADVPLAFAVTTSVDPQPFDFLFLDLQNDPDNLLPVSRRTRDALVSLGSVMADDGTDAPAEDSGISAAYTYLGQFVVHDIMFEASLATRSQLTSPVLEPLPLNRIREETQNVRTGALELDSIYGLPAMRDPRPNDPKMKVGEVTLLDRNAVPFLRPPGKDDYNDLPREGRSADLVHDRAALIGDPRNDENLILSQLHVAFLRAHNRLVDEAAPPNRFMKAKRRLRRHYQFIVLHDFLKQIADPQIVDDIIANGNRVYDPDENSFFMPLEFSVAAFRFGHSMVRAEYDYNVNFNTSGDPGTIPATLDLLFTFTALSGQLRDFPTLPENWIIEWENFFPGGQFFNRARRIDTELVEPLQHLQVIEGQDEPGIAAKLAVRNLLRGYLLRMPTGQAVARALRQKLQGVRDIPVLTAQQIRQGAANQRQVQVLEEAGFLERTPLWYYILAEAAVLGGGQHLGPVGSTIVAEVLVGLVRRSPDSILDPESDWEPSIPSAQPGTFTLPDLLRFAGFLTEGSGEPGYSELTSPDFDAIFSRLYEVYGEPSPSLESAMRNAETSQRTKQLIDDTINSLELAGRVRADARHFLLVNYHQLVVMPLLDEQAESDNSLDELYAQLREDTETILTTADRLAQHRGNPSPASGELSAHVVLDATSESWNDLNISSSTHWNNWRLLLRR
jgi:hypothetical protein